MNRDPVSSSNIDSIGYDPKTYILEVQFDWGGVYQYAGVDVTLYNGLMSSPSIGEYFDRFIKKAGYRSVRIS